ncbi:MAG TPA: Spy/CpxP family protein refolding chaperone [Tenuifilaceae bacterium]|nr:Spy/CpxP family protein refolding chaperone [Tenuifilaceae bacterium]HRX31825.1 Spy/CpxP family protein refolding chaperone [Tenuifilaceae bacterium]
MKRIASIFTVAILLASLTASAQTPAPRAKGGNGLGQCMVGECNIPNLTDEQKQKIDDLRVKHIKEVTPIKNELNEKRAHLHTLETADKPNLNEINKTIDEISALRAEIMKKNAAHRLDVASLLTDEQRVFFNSRPMGKRGMRGNRMGRGMGMGLGDGSGQEMGKGMGPCQQK